MGKHIDKEIIAKLFTRSHTLTNWARDLAVRSRGN